MKKNEFPKVSICMPVYNEENDLKNISLPSIVGQDYPRDKIEIILVDDYSTDKTVEVAKSFGAIILKNGSKDNETGRNIGYKKASGELFMCLDADMAFATKDFLKKMVKPFIDDKRIAGNFVCFKPNAKQPSLTRCVSYDPFQRDPIYKILTIGPEKIIKKEMDGWYLCKCDKKTIPPQGCMLYRKELVKDYSDTHVQLTDNEIPAHLVYSGHKYFAFVPSTGIEHWLIRSYKELWFKRTRNIRIYSEIADKRRFKWFELKKDWPKAAIWIIYTNSFIFPIINAIYKSFKYKDLALLNEPMVNLVSTYAIIYSTIFSGKMFKILQ